MAEQPGVMGPGSYPIRDPRDKSMESGRMLNPPRFMGRGGLSGPSKWEGNRSPGEQSGDGNVIKLEGGGPTGVKGAKKTSQSQMGA
jgi:hypothetical protein